jgi:hypothetical protein
MKIIEVAGLKVGLEKMPAFDGFEAKRRAIEFSETNDARVRRAFVLDVMSFAVVIAQDGNQERLDSAAAIDYHCKGWSALETILNAVLTENGIDPASTEFHLKAWRHVGAEVADRFVAALTNLSTPALDLILSQKAAHDEVKA